MGAFFSALREAGTAVLAAWRLECSAAFAHATGQLGQGLGLWHVPADSAWAPWLLGISAQDSSNLPVKPDGSVEQQVPAHALCLLGLRCGSSAVQAPAVPHAVWGSGPASAARLAVMAPQELVITFLFQARVLPALTGQPARAFRDQRLPDDVLLRLLHALTAVPAVDAVSLALREEWSVASRVCRALAVCESVRSAANVLAWPARRLQRFCDRHFGLTPEQMRRLFRLHQSARLLDLPAASSHQGAAWAAEAGYFDQSHMARDFRQLLKLPPGRAQRDSRALLQAGADLADGLLRV